MNIDQISKLIINLRAPYDSAGICNVCNTIGDGISDRGNEAGSDGATRVSRWTDGMIETICCGGGPYAANGMCVSS